MHRTCWVREMKAWLHARVTTEKQNFSLSVWEKKVLLQQNRNRKELGDILKEVKNKCPRCQ